MVIVKSIRGETPSKGKDFQTTHKFIPSHHRGGLPLALDSFSEFPSGLATGQAANAAGHPRGFPAISRAIPAISGEDFPGNF